MTIRNTNGQKSKDFENRVIQSLTACVHAIVTITTTHQNKDHAMNITSIIDLLGPLAAAGVNIGLTGQPGVGKTESIKAWASTLKASDIRPDLAEPGDDDRPVRFIPISVSTKESVDVSGLPHIEGSVTKWSPPDWVPTGNTAAVVFLDEFMAGDAAVQLAFQRLVDRDLDGCQVSPRALFIIAGNRPEDGCHASEVPMHIRNRCCWFEVDADVPAWRSWAEQNGVLKVVIDFIGYRPQLLNQFSAKLKTNAYATPRSVTRLSSVLERADKAHWMMLAAGMCGPTFAAELMQFVKLYDAIPSIDDVLNNASTYELPNDFGVLNALTSAVIRAAKADKSKSAAVVTLVGRIFDNGHGELAAKMLRDISAVCPEIFATPGTATLFAKMQPLLSA
jgi:MoxR-like ATPase